MNGLQGAMEEYFIFVNYDHFYVNTVMLTAATTSTVFFTIFNSQLDIGGVQTPRTPNIDLQ